MSIKPSFDDVIPQDNDWIDLYAVLGIIQGQALTLQNKGSKPVLVLLRIDKPAAGSTSGYELRSTENNFQVPYSNGMGLWVKGSSAIHVLVGWDVK